MDPGLRPFGFLNNTQAAFDWEKTMQQTIKEIFCERPSLLPDPLESHGQRAMFLHHSFGPFFEPQALARERQIANKKVILQTKNGTLNSTRTGAVSTQPQFSQTNMSIQPIQTKQNGDSTSQTWALFNAHSAAVGLLHSSPSNFWCLASCCILHLCLKIGNTDGILALGKMMNLLPSFSSASFNWCIDAHALPTRPHLSCVSKAM